MNIQKKISKYSGIIWADQLPPEEESFLFDLLNGRPSASFHYDPESDYSLFLACNAQKCNFKGYSSEQVSAFQDILRMYKLQKLNKIPVISKVLKLLNENDIVPVLVKGAAFLCHYAPELPRMMGDIDLYVPPDQFDKAVSLSYELGFEFFEDTGYHICLTSEKLDMDIHRSICKNGGDLDSDIYDRLIPCTFLGSRVYVLSPEDMLLHQLINRGQDISLRSHEKRHFKWIIDCYSILKFCRPDADSLLEKAKKLKNTYYTELTLSKLTALFPDSFDHPMTSPNDRNYCRFLRCVAKKTRLAERFPTRSSQGLRYVFSAWAEKWLTAKSDKIVSGSRKTVLQIMLTENDIRSRKDVIFRLKRLFRNGTA